MISGIKKTQLTKEAILDKISPYDIFHFYMPKYNWQIGVVTYSPFRNEKNPSFIISYRNHSLRFYDFADTDKKGDCFDFVKLYYNLSSYYEALKMIDKDFSLGIFSGEVGDYKKIISEYTQPLYIPKKEHFIQVKTRKFTNLELEYWNQYYQDIDDLRKNNVYSIDTLYLNKKRVYIKDTEMRFGYLYEGYWKIYKPFSDKADKWFPNNVPITMMDGLQNINNCEVALITKSKKDYMVTSKVFPCSCAVQNEGIGGFSTENVTYLRDNSERQVLSFDSDDAGVKNSLKITEKFGFEYCNVPRIYLKEGIKDWADLAKKHSLKKVEQYLNKI